MEWIVEISPEFSDGQRVADYLKTQGKIVHEMTDRPSTLVWPRALETSIGYGSVNFCLRMSRQPAICEGIFDWYIGLRCSTYYNQVYDMLGRNAVFLPYGALEHVNYATMFPGHKKLFVRPDASIKEFDGKIFSVEDLKRANELPEFSRNRDGLVVVSEVVRMGKEYRVFCRGGEAICSSSYQIPPDPDVAFVPAPQDVVLYAEEASRRLLDSGNILAIDVADDHGVLRLVEINGVNSAGLYGCNIGKFVDAMEAEALERMA